MNGDEPVYRPATTKGVEGNIMWRRSLTDAPTDVLYHFVIPCKCAGDDDF